jgi:hypothetical protein
MKNVRHLNREQLVDIVLAVQAQLYLGETGAVDGETIVEVWDPANEWSGADVCEALANKLSTYDLVPEFRGDEPEETRSRCEICGGPDH